MDILNTRNSTHLRAVFPTLTEHQNNLTNLNRWWDKVALVGKINSLNVPQSLLSNMLETKAEFAELQELLIDNLLSEQIQQVGDKYLAMAQTLIDIPNRNLFERTADVGFLATDANIIAFLQSAQIHPADTESMQQHLLEYAAKYSVYDDVILFDNNGSVKARMNTAVAAQLGIDPVVFDVLNGEQEYVEICRYSSICPQKRLSSLFLAAVKDPESGERLGVLCLSFKLEDEMATLFAELNDYSGTIMSLLDEKGNVLVSTDSSLAGSDIRIRAKEQLQLVSFANHQYFCTVAPTRGYQGYTGLNWQGCVLIPFSKTIEQPVSQSQTNDDDVNRWQGFSATLSGIQRRAKIVTDDLDLVVLNGRIAAARSDADEFIPILEEIRQIGRKMQSIFSRSVSQLMSTALNTHYNTLGSQATLAIDIMDRNLYERANDCRWWALTEHIVRLLSAGECHDSETNQLTAILAYINGLYTVYTGIYVYNSHGTVVAVSQPALQAYVGTTVPEETNWRGVLGLNSTQQYVVSGFNNAEYYEQRPTYIYNAAVLDNGRAVGGIGLVFDSEPEFQHMLNDVLKPHGAKRMGLFIDRHGKVISGSDNSLWQAGDQLALPASLLQQEKGNQGAGIYVLQDQEYVIGYAVSKGYREYKTDDGYSNDVIALILEKNVA
ncbi:cache domain-containing protein [Alteromonas lipolytica]|uniref:Chemotaxis protein CheW n=1 Tax=Alteromonas lipolytica TaxID=1856405 RepID=A0A1E8FCY1_9ALTE|nr:cache domain-containing protein [Alteromonas lipolytica]OFI33784.1 hypothetical protein BFC17_19630 [Alteromonas lipolytica]GGF68397.1 hypothetical protein GCM10011338_20770 [Alteromonas lipolytica]